MNRDFADLESRRLPITSCSYLATLVGFGPTIIYPVRQTGGIDHYPTVPYLVGIPRLELGQAMSPPYQSGVFTNYTICR